MFWIVFVFAVHKQTFSNYHFFIILSVILAIPLRIKIMIPTHGKCPVDNDVWLKRAGTFKTKIEILTELYARTKIALRDEIKSNALRKQIVTESLGYTDLIQKDFLNESLLEYNKESVEKLNRALEKDLMKSAEGESVSMSNLAQFDYNLFANLMGKVAFGGKQ